MNKVLEDCGNNSFICLRKTCLSYNWQLILNWHWLGTANCRVSPVVSHQFSLTNIINIVIHEENFN